MTNNVAEYRAVLLGLELAKELGAEEVEVINDSQLVSRQIGGEYKVKHKDMKPLYLETMHALREFERWSVRSVRREHNERADELVNETLDARAWPRLDHLDQAGDQQHHPEDQAGTRGHAAAVLGHVVVHRLQRRLHAVAQDHHAPAGERPRAPS